MFELYPIAMTHGEMRPLIEVCQKHLGFSPTRGLDAAGLNPKTDPAAFLAALSLDNRPLDTLRQGRAVSNILSHSSLSFVAVLPPDVLIGLQSATRLKLHARQGKRDYVVIISGTMDEWHDALVAGCSRGANPDVRMLMSQALRFIEQTGFREVFQNYDHIVNAEDNTTILVRHADRSY